MCTVFVVGDPSGVGRLEQHVAAAVLRDRDRERASARARASASARVRGSGGSR